MGFGHSDVTDQDTQLTELQRCFDDNDGPGYFINNYVKILDPVLGEWISFALWDDQEMVLETLISNNLCVFLKARQLGLTWLVLAYALWVMLFRPEATVLLFSRRDTEAIYLLDDRLKEMYRHLPDWMKYAQEIVEDSAHEWMLDTGSVARAFPTSAGDSYTATLAIVDEADLVPDLNRLLRAVKPTIDAGGRMVLLSRSDKTKPASTFKKVYRAAKRGLNDWAHVFLPWYSRPTRTQEWYEAQERDVLAREGSLDDLHEQYPATDTEALSPASKDKRISQEWLKSCYVEREPLTDAQLEQSQRKVPAINGLRIYVLPQPGARYRIGVDPAEGNPTSDDSALVVLNLDSQEQVAELAEKLEPSVLAEYANAVGVFYDKASLLVERNNHGHAVLLWLNTWSRLEVLVGIDRRPGWLTTVRSKVLMYTIAVEAVRDALTTIYSEDAYLQLSSIETSTLRAPGGELDDIATAYALALVACVMVEAETRVDDSLYVEVGY